MTPLIIHGLFWNQEEFEPFYLLLILVSIHVIKFNLK